MLDKVKYNAANHTKKNEYYLIKGLLWTIPDNFFSVKPLFSYYMGYGGLVSYQIFNKNKHLLKNSYKF